jgi:hypothetical protein
MLCRRHLAWVINWHSVEFGVGSSGLSFKAARDIVTSAASSVDQAANAAKAAEQAATVAASPTSNIDPAKRAAIEKAKQDAQKAAADAQRNLQDVTRSLGGTFGKRVCIPWC